MPRLSDSLQRPTTLLTLKKSKESLINYLAAGRGQIVLMTDDAGTLNGEIRIATGNTLPGTPTTFDIYGNPVDVAITSPIYPVGSIIYFAGPQPPPGFLFCNGALYKKNLYRELCEYLDGNNTASPYYANTTHFYIPDYTNKNNYNQGGLFIRNLNEGGSNQNTIAPDVTETNVFDLYQKGEYTNPVPVIQIDRKFGSIQQEKYPYHNHEYVNANTANVNASFSGNTGEIHAHKYFGTLGAENGIQLGNLDTQGALRYATISRSALGTTDEGADTKIRNMPAGSVAGVDYDSAVTGLLSSPAFQTGQEFPVGMHVHVGWLGYGQSYSDPLHTTFHFKANNVNNSQYVTTSLGTYFDPSANNFNNMRETQPKNYSVLFCIKY